MSSIFIDFPWSRDPSNEIYASSDQVKVVYDIILKAFYYKYKFEKSFENGVYIEAKKYNLDDVKVFNTFVNEIIDKVLDPVAREYTLDTVRCIKSNNFKKKSVQVSYFTLYKIFEPDSIKVRNLRYMVSDAMQLIDFRSLFKTANKSALTDNSEEIKEINNTYKIVINMHKIERNLF